MCRKKAGATILVRGVPKWILPLGSPVEPPYGATGCEPRSSCMRGVRKWALPHDDEKDDDDDDDDGREQEE